MKKIISLILLCFAVSCATVHARMPETMTGSVGPDVRMQADAYYHFIIASTLEQEGKFDAAINEYRHRMDPNSAEIALSLASLSLRKGELDRAERYAQKAAELQPGKTQPLMLLAGISAGRKKYDEAIAAYRKVIALDPGQEEPYIYLGSSAITLR
jgi:tetratricopeptide (TPR) repeat protein